MRLRLGYDLAYDCPQPTPMILALNVHFTRVSDMETPDHIHVTPSVPMAGYRDGFGNWCTRIVMPAGRTRLTTDAVIRDSGLLEPVVPEARQHPVQELPEDTLVFLLGSRYCDTSDQLSQMAWDRFGMQPTGWLKVQAICDFVHSHIQFGYEFARPTRTASEGFAEARGVCRDFAHLAIALCRGVNIPARYCTGYLGDVGMPPPYSPGDFSAWFEAYIGGQWHIFDPRNNAPRIGRVLMARGRDAADVAISTSFGPNLLVNFKVWTDEMANA